MTKTKFFSILSKLVAKGFDTNGAKAEVVTYISGNTDLAVVVETADGSKFKRVTFHREPKAAADLCEKFNRWIVRFNLQNEEVVEVETVEARGFWNYHRSKVTNILLMLIAPDARTKSRSRLDQQASAPRSFIQFVTDLISNP